MSCGVSLKCSKKLVSYLRFVFLVSALFPLAACVLTAVYIDTAAAVLPLAAVLALLWASARYAPAYYGALSYCRERSFFRIDKGVIWGRSVLIPYGRIQYIDLRRTAAEKLCGTCTLFFVTPGGKTALRGLEPDEAEHLRDLIMTHQGR